MSLIIGPIPRAAAKFLQFFKKKFAGLKIIPTFAIPNEKNGIVLKSLIYREHSSVGLEHLPYKQRVGGSTPSAPTRNSNAFSDDLKRHFLLYISILSVKSEF